MLTVRVLKVADDEARLAVEPSLSPETFARPEDPPYRRANTMWVGSPEALLPVRGGSRGKADTHSQFSFRVNKNWCGIPFPHGAGRAPGAMCS